MSDLDVIDTDRTPPHDTNAEQCVLGGMLLSPDAAIDAAQILTTSDFYKPVHGIVFDAIAAVDRAGNPADTITVAAHLTDTGGITRLPGGASYLHTLIHTVPTAANTVHYARIVAGRAALRRLIAVGTRITQIGYGAAGGDALEVADAVERAQTELHSATSGDTTGAVTWSQLSATLLDEIEAHATGGQQLRGIPTGYLDLDRLLNGYRPGQLIVVAGRPGMGKSVFAVDAFRNAVFHRGLSAAMFSLEMDASELGQRILSAESGVPLSVLHSGGLTDSDLIRASKTLGELDDAGGRSLHIDDSPDLNLATIRARARRIQQRSGLDLVVIDYIQLMQTAARRDNREQEVAAMSRGLKLMAKELGCPVIACAQLNRGPEQRQDKRPVLADLRESGAIENDADVVVLLHREDYYDKESPRSGELDLIVAKNRHGATDTITVAAQLHRSRLVDMAVGDTDPYSAAALTKASAS